MLDDLYKRKLVDKQEHPATHLGKPIQESCFRPPIKRVILSSSFQKEISMFAVVLKQ
jgi:hypothetical protein